VTWPLPQVWTQYPLCYSSCFLADLADTQKRLDRTRPSILCVTHQMNHKRRNSSAVPYKMMNCKWYQQVLGQYKAILSGTWWYWVSKNWHFGITWYRVSNGLVCMYIVYIGKSGDLVGCYRCLTYSLTDNRR